MFRYEKGAIQDYKTGDISIGKMLYIFEVSYNGYRELLKLSDNIDKLPDEIICETLNKIRIKELRRLKYARKEGKC